VKFPGDCGLRQTMGEHPFLNYELKGGTSLSKGFRIIGRFSEDIATIALLMCAATARPIH
jgi:hypothetical protein